jgi:DNA-binding response OmpR family regulator
MVGIVAYALETQGFEVITAYDGQQAMDKYEQMHPDILILDIMLPKLNGLEICQRIRETTTTPVILLTARKEDEDVIKGLEIGADDYITKPFNPRAVALRAQAVLRRSGWGRSRSEILIGDLKIDTRSHQITLQNQIIHISPNEFDLLLCLALNAGRVISWQTLLKSAWNIETWDGGKEMVKTAIYRLRQRIEKEPENPEYILTVRGVGYTMPPASGEISS